MGAIAWLRFTIRTHLYILPTSPKPLDSQLSAGAWALPLGTSTMTAYPTFMLPAMATTYSTGILAVAGLQTSPSMRMWAVEGSASEPLGRTTIATAISISSSPVTWTPMFTTFRNLVTNRLTIEELRWKCQLWKGKEAFCVTIGSEEHTSE